MRKLSRPVCIAFGIVTLFASCAEEAFVNYDHVVPKLVVQGQLSPNETFKISIKSSLSPTDPSQYIIPEGVNPSLINLTTGSVVNLYRENDFFVDPHAFPQAGQSYKLFVVAPGYESIEAVTSVPPPIELQAGRVMNLKFEDSEASESKMNVVYDLELDFKPHNHRYFHFSFIQTTSINMGSVDTPDIQERAYYINPQFPDEDGFYEHHETGVLIDTDKTGTGETLSFSFVDYTLGDIEELGMLYIEVRSVTEEYYNYFTSLTRQLLSRDDPFAEPIPVFNNIEDGLGNFSAYSSTVRTIQIIP